MSTRIRVSCYAGVKGDERPLSFTLDGVTLQVIEILDRWYDPDYDFFKVRGDNQRSYLLRHDLNQDAWDLVSSAPSP
jgi:hypothetical protein